MVDEGLPASGHERNGESTRYRGSERGHSRRKTVREARQTNIYRIPSRFNRKTFAANEQRDMRAQPDRRYLKGPDILR